MSEKSVYVPVQKLVNFMVDALVAMKVPQDESKIIADVLITSDPWGVRSHGIAHLKMYHERMKRGLQLPTTNITVVKDTPTTAVLDGGNGMGMVVGYKAMNMAIEKARKFGLGAVAVRNFCASSARSRYP
jgi:L-2-hydroxycarboxylate dehydrogenase (NAD+)